MTTERELISALVADIAAAHKESLEGWHEPSRQTLLDAMRAGNAFLAAPVSPAPLSADVVFKAARAFSDKTADKCGVDRDDQWNIYGDSFRADVLFVLNAAHGIKP
jgi:hypothetical protein